MAITQGIERVTAGGQPGKRWLHAGNSIRKARATGKFTATELAELDAPPLASATGPDGEEEGLPACQTPGGITASGCTLPEPTVSLPAAAAKTRTPPATGPEGDAEGSATGQTAGGATASGAGPGPMASASSGTGQATCQAATGQAAQTPRPSATAQAPQAPLGRAGTVPVVAIGNAIVLRADAVRAAGLMKLAETRGAGELPAWSVAPKECGFKIARPGQRGQQHHATSEGKAAQCRAYGAVHAVGMGGVWSGIS